MNRQRPYRRSPPLDSQEDHYRKQILRSDLSMLQQQNNILKLKCKKVSQLEDKVEMVLKQNAQLLSENEKLSRFLHQQKSDNEVARNKCETLANQKVAIMGEFELERKKMLRELELLGDRLSEEEALKNAQVNEMRGQYQVEMQNLRRQFQNSENSYQAELRKLREQLDKRDHDLADYANRLKRVTTEGDYEILRLKEEREKLRNELVYVEADHIKEVEALKNKYQTGYQQEVEALKRVHLNNLQEAQLENARLKEGLEDQCRENEALASKANKQRAYYEDTISYLKRDCEALRAKVVETKQLGDLQVSQLREKMRLYHQADIDDLQEKQAMHLRSYQEEIHRLQSINHGKNVEIEQLIKDRVATRGIFDSELLRVRDQYATLLQRHKDLELRHADLISQSNNRLADREKHIEYLQEVIRTQKANHESESIALQKLVESLKQELSNEKLVFRENEQHLKEELAQAGHELSETKAKAEQEKVDYERQITDLRNELSGTSHNLSSRADALNNKNRMIQKENQGLKNNITLKQKEIRNLVERLKASSQRESKLQAQIDELRTKMVKREQRANQSIGQQKGRLQASFNYALENLKSDHETALRLEANRYRDLQEKLRRKQAQLQQLLRMYKKMTEQIQALTQQQANKKELTLKFPGATADLIATKNLFDVYLKTKVLQVCGDAMKENKG